MEWVISLDDRSYLYLHGVHTHMTPIQFYLLLEYFDYVLHKYIFQREKTIRIIILAQLKTVIIMLDFLMTKNSSNKKLSSG